MAIRISNIKAKLETTPQQLQNTVAELLAYQGQFTSFKIVKKAIDARNKGNVHFVYAIEVETDVDEDALIAQLNNKDVEKAPVVSKTIIFSKNSSCRPVIVGSGPGGMLAGIALAESGLRPIILERGREVEQRRKDVSAFWKTGVLDEVSNVQFGEGGAGTFSDGKLMSGIRKDQFTAKVLQEFTAAGAPEEILYLAKPHIGTDKLVNVVRNIRRKIVELGGEYRFENCLRGLIIKDGRLIAVKVSDASGALYELPTERLILATGHSARDTFEMLYASGVAMASKPFAVGVRIEHRQELINKSQYGKFMNSPYLGAADYKMAVHLPNGRSAFTFCMCPGGEVVAAASEKGRLATNGMSEFARDKINANAALLVGVSPADFSGDHPLRGMYFQRDIEQKAFIAGGKDYKAPIQLVGDLLKGKESHKLGEVTPSYRPGVVPTRIDRCLPNFVIETLKPAIIEMDKKLHGFACYDAVLTAVESRSSSPVRIVRDENFESNIKGIYPCGEGAGYAGGIMSAAADGLKCAQKLLESL